MKFICPSCKAKYQIADEKISARPVRMKCRKCTEILEIGKQGAKLSVPPPAVAPKSQSHASASADPPRATPAPRQSSPFVAHRPGLVPRPGGGAVPRSPAAAAAGATQLRTSPAAAAPGRAPSAIRAKPSAPQPKAAGVEPSPSPSRVEPGVGSAASTTAEPKARPDSAPPPSALAGAFSAAVAEPAVEDHGAAEEWFVGINGVPVGPIRLSELRSKAASGAVNGESLVWRDGFEEWKALSTFPELVAIVEESRSSVHAVPVPPTAPAAQPPESVAVTVPRTEVAAVAAPVVAAAVAPVVTTAEPKVEIESQADLEALAGLRGRSRFSGAQLFAMVVAIAFGLTIGFVMFSGSVETREVVKYVEVPTEAKQNAAKAEQNSEDEPAEEEEETETEQQTRTGKSGGTKGKVTKKDTTTGLKGLSGLSGLAAGPSGPAGNSGSKSTSGKPLDSAAVQSTVSRYTSSVKRSCWQPALDTRDANAPTSARVAVTITVAASGNVQNVSTSGDPRGYRGLASCIARRVRGWQFPPSSGPTTVNVPFVFAAQ